MDSYLLVMRWTNTKKPLIDIYIIDNPRFAVEGIYPASYRVKGQKEVVKGGLFPWRDVHSLEKLPE